MNAHAADYRRPEQLLEGAILVVGSGQSGVQIAEDLLQAGRDVYLCTSLVGRAPQRYRGRDVIEWFQLTNMAEQRPEDLDDPGQVHARQPQISGTRGGHTVSLQQLARDGVQLLGRFRGVKGRVLRVDGDLEANVAQGDAVSNGLEAKLDAFIPRLRVAAPPCFRTRGGRRQGCRVHRDQDRRAEAYMRLKAVALLPIAAAVVTVGSAVLPGHRPRSSAEGKRTGKRDLGRRGATPMSTCGASRTRRRVHGEGAQGTVARICCQFVQNAEKTLASSTRMSCSSLL